MLQLFSIHNHFSDGVSEGNNQPTEYDLEQYRWKNRAKSVWCGKNVFYYFAITPTEVGEYFQLELVASASSRLTRISNDFYTDITGVGMLYFD